MYVTKHISVNVSKYSISLSIVLILFQMITDVNHDHIGLLLLWLLSKKSFSWTEWDERITNCMFVKKTNMKTCSCQHTMFEQHTKLITDVFVINLLSPKTHSLNSCGVYLWLYEYLIHLPNLKKGKNCEFVVEKLKVLIF